MLVRILLQAEIAIYDDDGIYGTQLSGKFHKKVMNRFREKCVTNGRTNGRTDRTKYKRGRGAGSAVMR